MRLIACLAFYPTLAWNLLLHRLFPSRRWWDWIDDWVLLGALPLASHVPKLKAEGISAVINTCREYRGPLAAYADAKIEQLHLPIVDFTPPTLQDVHAGLEFLQRHIGLGNKVYVHCKAGRARSATLVLCYLVSKGMSPVEAQAHLLQKRPHVNPHLLKRQVVIEFCKAMAARKEKSSV